MALVRSVLEYGALVWHTLIPTFLSDEDEKIQKRAFRISYPQNHYSEALVLFGFQLLSERRSSLCRTIFKKISQPTSRLNYLVPKVGANVHNYELRNNQTFTVPRCRTERFKRSFIPSMCNNRLGQTWIYNSLSTVVLYFSIFLM